MRRNFSKSVRVAVIKRATVDGRQYCEQCGVLCKVFEIDHVIPDALGGEPTPENAKLLCEECHGAKTKRDVANIAKAKRVEAKHLGASRPKAKIPSRKREPREPRDKLPMPARRAFYEDAR